MKMKVTLRFVEYSDIPFIQQYCSKKEVSETTSIPYPYPKDGAERWYKMVSKNKEEGKSYEFTILYDNEFAGIVSVKQKENGLGSIDYWVAPPYWKKGIGTLATRKAINFAFNELGLSTMESFCLSSNIASKRILEKNGFVFLNEKILDFANHKGETFSFYRLEHCNT
jgi:RimJ/RimL family protein N-acetyltransferase